MQLFKRVLLSLFPDDMMANNVNPASMFISFISAKEFFSIINRKIIENYKLNLFDISIDPFEFKIGFGDNKGINKKDIDLYYGYCGTANINGYRFMNPSNIGNTLSLIVGMFVEDLFDEYKNTYFINFMFTVYLLNFVFLSRIKVFPYKDRQKNFNRFIDVFFNFYITIFQQSGETFDIDQFMELRKNLISEIDIFFMLFEHYQKFNELYYNDIHDTDGDFYKWIFYDEIKDTHLSELITNFIDHRDDFIYKSTFSLVEKKILQYVLPADILLKYLFLDADIKSVFSCIVTKVYDKEKFGAEIKKFRSGKGNLEKLYLDATDYRNFKKSFFDGVQKYIVNVFRSEDIAKGTSLEEDIDDMMSDIGGDPDNLKDLKIPERIKKESKIMEKILNFYVTLIGGLGIARGDSLELRLSKKDMINDILDKNGWSDNKNNTIHYYGSLLYNYGKNVFYYKNVAENVRAGKQKFFLPYKNTSKNIYSNMHIVRMFEENFVTTLLQWINTKDIRLYVNNKKILDEFKKSFGKDISTLAKKDKNDLLKILYNERYVDILENNQLEKTLKKHFTDDDIYHIKDNMYSLDFWIYVSLLDGLKNINLKADYSDTNIFGIIASIMETLPGFLLYITFMKGDKKVKNTDILYDIYCVDVLNISKTYCKALKKMILNIESKFETLLNLRIDLDDNKSYFKIAMGNWNEFTKGKDEIYKSVSGEDVLWFKGFLKNITYYNKRYLIPK